MLRDRGSFVSFVAAGALLLGSAATPALAGLAATAVNPQSGETWTYPRQTRGELDPCREVEELDGPACSAAPATCLDASEVGICLRQGFVFRLTMCARANENSHEGHRFAWSAMTSLPPSLELRTPPSANTTPDPTSTAYLGGDITIDPSPPVHNGKFFGLVTEEFCGPVKIQATDQCPTTLEHLVCSADFPAIVRSIAMPNPSLPFPDFDTTSVPPGVLGAFYDELIEGIGGTGSYLFSIVSGALPDGVELKEDGTLSGTPTEGGDFVFRVKLEEDPDAPIFTNPEGCAEAPRCPALSVELTFLLVIIDPTSSTTTTTTTSSSTTTSSTVPVCPFPTDKCGRPLNPASEKPKASDCLFILRAAVGSQLCCLCPCDVDSSKKIGASDALLCLKNSVGQPTELECDECPVPD